MLEFFESIKTDMARKLSLWLMATIVVSGLVLHSIIRLLSAVESYLSSDPSSTAYVPVFYLVILLLLAIGISVATFKTQIKSLRQKRSESFDETKIARSSEIIGLGLGRFIQGFREGVKVHQG